MRTYKPRFSILAGAMALSALFLGAAAFIAERGMFEVPRDRNSVLPMGCLALLFAAFGLVFLYGCVQLSAWFQTDADGITRRAFWGTRRLE